ARRCWWPRAGCSPARWKSPVHRASAVRAPPARRIRRRRRTRRHKFAPPAPSSPRRRKRPWRRRVCTPSRCEAAAEQNWILSPLPAKSRPRPARISLAAPPREAPTDRPASAGPNRPAAGSICNRRARCLDCFGGWHVAASACPRWNPKMRRPPPHISYARGCTPPICDDIRPWRSATVRSPPPPGARQLRFSFRELTRAAAPRAHTRSTYGANGTAFRLQSSREVVQTEKTRRVTPKNLLFIGCGDYQSVHDVDVLPGIDRHRAVIGAEHDPIHAEHLHRLAYVRRPEAHGVDVKFGEIIARPLLAANDGALRHALAAEPPAEIEPSDDR